MDTVSVTNGSYLLKGIQVEPRKFIPCFLGNFVLWLFFRRLDTLTRISIEGLSERK